MKNRSICKCSRNATNLFAFLALSYAGFVSAIPFNCDTTSDDLWAIYQKGAKAKIGNLTGWDAPNWEKARLSVVDKKILDHVWFMTGDYSKRKRNQQDDINLWSNPDEAEISTHIQQQCLGSNYNRCNMHYNDEYGCAAFYGDRYSKVLDRLNQARETLIKERWNHEGELKRAIKRDFSVPSNQLFIVGVGIRRPGDPDIKLKRWGIQQANLSAERHLELFLNAPEPALSKGEFETTADFEKRSADVMRKYALEKKQRSEEADKYAHDILEEQLNRFAKPGYELAAMRYNADRGFFEIEVYFNNVADRVTMRLDVPMAKAKEMKAWLLDPKDWTGGWIFFERRGNTLSLVGGYLGKFFSPAGQRSLKKLIPLQGSLKVEIGKQAAERFAPQLAKAVQELKDKEAAESIAQRASRCDSIANAASHRSPKRYWVIMRVNGCL